MGFGRWGIRDAYIYNNNNFIEIQAVSYLGSDGSWKTGADTTDLTNNGPVENIYDCSYNTTTGVLSDSWSPGTVTPTLTSGGINYYIIRVSFKRPTPLAVIAVYKTTGNDANAVNKISLGTGVNTTTKALSGFLTNNSYLTADLSGNPTLNRINLNYVLNASNTDISNIAVFDISNVSNFYDTLYIELTRDTASSLPIVVPQIAFHDRYSNNLLLFCGSIYFGTASSNRISYSQSSGGYSDFGGNPFTIEWFQFLPSSPASTTPRVFSIGNNQGPFAISCEPLSGTAINGIKIGWGGITGTPSSTYYPSSVFSNFLDRWHHIAIIRVSNTSFKIFYDGNNASGGTIGDTTFISATNFTIPSSGYTVGIGNQGSVNGTTFQGYISNFRISKSNIYSVTDSSTSITVPTIPLSSSGASLLFRNLTSEGSGSTFGIVNSGTGTSTLTISGAVWSNKRGTSNQTNNVWSTFKS